MATKIIRVFQEFTIDGYVPFSATANLDFGVTVANTFPGTTPSTYQTDDPDIEVDVTTMTDFYVWIRGNGQDWNINYTRNVRVYPDSPDINNVVMGVIIANLPGIVPYEGATQDVDIRPYGLYTQFVQFSDTVPAFDYPTDSGTIYYDVDDETLNLIGLGGTVQQIGQEIYYPKCSNNTGTTILNGTLVMVNPTQIVQGEKLSIQPAITDGTYSADLVLGLATQDITNNGMVTWFGYVRDIDTANINLGSETWAVGNILYGDPANAGGLTNVEPTAPNHKSKIAVITKLDAGGIATLMVRPTLGQHLFELHDVNIDTITDNQGIIWDATNQRWENRNVVVDSGYLPLSDGDEYSNSPFFVDSNGYIGINATSLTGYSALAKNIVLYSAGNTGMTIHSGTTSKGTIFFANGLTGTDFYDGGIQYDHALNELSFYTQGANPIKMVGTQASSSINIVSTTTGNGGFFVGDTDDSTRGGIFYQNDATTDKLSIMSQGAYQIHITDKVGIGIIVPTYKLDVDGDIRITSGNKYYIGTNAYSVADSTNDGFLTSIDWNIFKYIADNGITGSGLNGYIPFWDGVGNISYSNLYWDDTNNRLGLGITSMSSYSQLARDIVIYNSSNAGITIHSGNTSKGTIFFADGLTGTDFYRGGISYDHTNDELSFYTQGANPIKMWGTGSGAFIRIQNTNNTGSGGYFFGDVDDSNVAGIEYTHSDDKLVINTGNAGRVYINDKFGIGVISPSYKLDVNGDINTSGVYRIGGVDKSTLWNTAYDNMIVSAGVSGTTTKTLTLTQQDGGTITASWTDYDTAPVTSVFGRTGIVIAQSGDYSTTLVTEGTNLYYTDARARASLSFSAGSGAYNSATGVITIPTNNNQITNGAGYITGINSSMVTTALGYTPVPNTRTLTINGTAYDLSADRSWTIAGTIGGLTTNYIPKATSSTTLGNSLIYDNGSGLIGIGTATPSYAVHIETPYATPLYLKSTTTGNPAKIKIENGDGNYFQLGNDGGFFIDYNSAEKVRITSAGLVGIGTSSPATTLHINGGTSTGLTITGTTESYINFGDADNNVGQIYYGHSNNTMVFRTNDGNRMYLNSNGYLGIGTSNPQADLHIQAPFSSIATLFIKGGNQNVTSIGEINSQIDFGSNDGSVNNTNNIGGRIASVTEATNGAYTGLAFYTFKQQRVPDLQEAVRITNDGFVGIGTSTPIRTLSLIGDFSIDNSTTPTAGMLIRANASANQIFSRTANNVSTGHPFEIFIGSSSAFYINTSRNVGIGTTAPSALLHLAYTNDAVLKVESTGILSTDDARIELITTNGTFSIQNDRSLGTSGALTFAGNTSNNIVIDHNTGLVGIGTASPASNLHIKTSTDSGYTHGLIVERSANSDRGYINYTGGGFNFRATDGDVLTFGQTSTEWMRINSTGLGIGTATPSAKVHIQGTNSGILFDTSSAYTPRIKASGILSDLELISIGNGGNLILTAQCTGASIIQFNNGGTERMRITSGGNVLIGTTTDYSYRLSVRSSANGDGIYYTDGTVGNWMGSLSSVATIGATTNHPFAIYTNGGERMRITSGGNVGIGTTAPSSKLEVQAGAGDNAFGLAGWSFLRWVTGNILEIGGFGYTWAGINFYTTGTERMRITNSGLVGIGTTAPSGQLSINNQVGIGVNPISSYSATSGVNGQNFFNGYYASASDGNGTYPRYLDIVSVGSPDGTNGGSNIRFFTNPIALNSPAVERMRITSGGELQVTGNGVIKNQETGGNYSYWLQTASETRFAIQYAQNLTFYTNASERMRITSGGLVGIGTSSPSGKLDVQGGYSYLNTLRLSGTDNNATIWKNSGDMGIYPQSGKLYLGGQGTRNVITVTSTNVGIGTTAPSYKLDVVGDINITGNYKVNGVNIGGSISGLTTNYVPRATSSTALGNSPIFIYNGVDFYFNQTSNSNSRFFIKANGSVSGTTYDLFTIQRNDSGSTTTAFKIQEDGLTCLDTYGTYSPGQYTTSSGANLYYDYYAGGILRMSTSSRRYKTDIVDYTKGLADVLNMRPRLYKGISDGERIFAGLIAEEIHDIGLTEFVNYNKENQPNALEYSRMVAILINAIKELKAELDELKK